MSTGVSRSAYGGVLGEQVAKPRTRRGQAETGDHAADQPPLDHPSGEGTGSVDVTGAERATGDRLCGDRDGVECEGEEGPDGQRQLVSGEVGTLTGGCGEHHGVDREEQGNPEGEGADQQRYAGLGRTTDAGPVRSQGGALGSGDPDHDEEEGGCARHLGEDRAERGSSDAQPVERSDAVHEEQVEGDVEDVSGHGDHERRPGVLQSAQDASRREHDQERGGAQKGDSEVDRGLVGNRFAGSERVHEEGGEQDSDDGGHQADHDRQPHAVDALAHGPATVPGAEAAGDAAGGAVGKEDAEANDRLQDRGGDAEPGQFGGAEVTDDGSVGEQEQRLGDQCEKRRKGKAQDLAVRRAQHVPRLAE